MTALPSLKLYPTEPLRDPYSLGDKLGEGSEGAVYEAWTPRGQNRCAIKLMKPSKKQSDHHTNETAMLKLAQGSHTIRYLDSFEGKISDLNAPQDPNPSPKRAIVMELLSGDIRKKKESKIYRSTQQIVIIARQGLEALQTFKEKKLIHGDLKTKNMAFENEKLTIFDFGTSQFQKKEGNNDLTQTVNYRAPEQLLRKNYDASIDMWSFGVILFELYTNQDLIFVRNNDKSNPLENEKQQRSDALHIILQQIGDFNSEIKPPTQPASQTAVKLMQGYEKHRGSIPLWQTRMHQAAGKRKLSDGAADPFIQLIAPMLRYENRITPEEAIKLCDQLFPQGYSEEKAPPVPVVPSDAPLLEEEKKPPKTEEKPATLPTPAKTSREKAKNLWKKTVRHGCCCLRSC